MLNRLDGTLLLHAQNGLTISRKLGRILKQPSKLDSSKIDYVTICLQELLDEYKADIVLSNENISVQASGFWQGKGLTPEVFAGHVRALKEAMPGVVFRVILGTRRQDYWLASRYAQSARGLPEPGQTDFDLRIAALCRQKVMQGPVEWLCYGRVIRILTEAMGAGNIMILPLEALEREPKECVMALGQFMGGRDLTDLVEHMYRQGDFDRQQNRRRQEGPVWQLSGGHGTIGLSSEQSDAILARFENDQAPLSCVVAPA